MRAALVVLAMTTPAMAEDLTYSSESTEACLAGGQGDACIGVSANICMDSASGSTTVGMGFCIGQELAFWDARLNAAYTELRGIERALDADRPTDGPVVPERAVALLEMQRAWITYRDSACLYEYSQWGGGTGGGPAHAACMMQITGEQALALESRLEDHQR